MKKPNIAVFFDLEISILVLVFTVFYELKRFVTLLLHGAFDCVEYFRTTSLPACITQISLLFIILF
jgi:hypothetical protein